MDANQNKQAAGSQGFSPAGNSSSYQGHPHLWNPYMYGLQGPPGAWFPQGFQHPTAPTCPPVEPIMQPAVTDEVDVEVIPTPSTERQGRTKLGNFNPNEDVYLVKAWLEISCDPIVGNDQKVGRFWSKVQQRYNFRKGACPERSVRSLQSRWGIIKREVGKFAGVYADVVRQNPSGFSDADKTTRAATDFAVVHEHHFPYMHCWEIMKDEPKWRDPIEPDVDTDPIGDRFGDDTGQDSNKVDNEANKSVGKRPMGRDRAKAASKKSKSGDTTSSDYASRMQDLSLQKISILQEENVRKCERFEQLAAIDEKRYQEMRCHNQSVLDIEQEKVRIMREKHDYLREKEEKQEDERILAIDLDSCSAPLQVYYRAMQEEILEKIAARRQKRQGP